MINVQEEQVSGAPKVYYIKCRAFHTEERHVNKMNIVIIPFLVYIRNRHDRQDETCCAIFYIV